MLHLDWWGRVFMSSSEVPGPVRGFQTSRPEPVSSEEELLSAIRHLVRKTAIQGYNKAWLENSLQAKLRSYPHLVGTMQEVAILLFISRSVARHCPFSFDMDELRRLWR
ncbi:hypothetical protein [Dinghuibacter silviterrae]|uniref:hypothetical protein n=1 Tax=Dinghuibacter silviterrae TaxID=1539049 RepID=UPI001063D0D1|nr:hypothetical protein [Dinghuibacter silviterrae]